MEQFIDYKQLKIVLQILAIYFGIDAFLSIMCFTIDIIEEKTWDMVFDIIIIISDFIIVTYLWRISKKLI